MVTDTVGATEEEWFSYLDRVESEAGVRDLSVQNGFDKTAFSLAASTDTSKPWGYSLTLGERLQQTPLKGSQGILDRLKTDLRSQMAAGQPTQAVVDALTLAYNTAFPASFPG
ncbi:MAG: hypothetical protein HC925_05925, partial [Coleofasciculaceae cyanobacterium SM2_3_26]|nr:hypothetical protein [Coleofasciculaceae cyanobacterium SM2_3_26]